MYQQPPWCKISAYRRSTGKKEFTVEEVFGTDVNDITYDKIKELASIGLIEYREGKNGGSIRVTRL